MTYQDAISYLNAFTNFESKLGDVRKKEFSLDSIVSFLSLIDNPHKKLKCVHIAGTKGKGSTAAMTAEMLRCAGYRVGLYTSPHLYDLRERIRILSNDSKGSAEVLLDGCISQQDFSALLNEFKNVLEGSFDGILTYFELLTALAFLHFQRQKVDIVVLETGLGGRLDATNVIDPLVCGVTLIDLEHTHILGDTLEKIALEKAGIIKSGCVVVSAPQDSVVEKVIRKTCVDCNVNVLFLGKEIEIEDDTLLGDFQFENTAMSISIIECLKNVGFNVADDAMEYAIKTFFWPARMEVVSQSPLIIVDSAHTPKSCVRLVENLNKKAQNRKMVLILGVSSDKDKKVIAKTFLGTAKKVILTKSSHERADDNLYEDVVSIFNEKNVKTAWASNVHDALSQACEGLQEDEMIVVAGSLYLAAEARKICYQHKE